jgi:hypothetical protein
VLGRIDVSDSSNRDMPFRNIQWRWCNVMQQLQRRLRLPFSRCDQRHRRAVPCWDLQQ